MQVSELYHDPPKGTECYNIREKRKCTLKPCVWCTNKWSPYPGAKGFCEWEEKVKELPEIVYDCKKVDRKHLDPTVQLQM
jgi:hypothetical protein